MGGTNDNLTRAMSCTFCHVRRQQHSICIGSPAWTRRLEAPLVLRAIKENCLSMQLKTSADEPATQMERPGGVRLRNSESENLLHQSEHGPGRVRESRPRVREHGAASPKITIKKQPRARKKPKTLGLEIPGPKSLLVVGADVEGDGCVCLRPGQRTGFGVEINAGPRPLSRIAPEQLRVWHV